MPRRSLPLLVLLLALPLPSCGDDRFDGDPGPGCDDGATSATLTFGEPLTSERAFQLTACAALDGERWRQTWSADPWVLRVEGGPLTPGELTAQGIVVTLDPGDGTTYRSETATVSVQNDALDEGPCGVWTTNPLTDGAGAIVSVSPQPVGFDCTLVP